LKKILLIQRHILVLSFRRGMVLALRFLALSVSVGDGGTLRIFLGAAGLSLPGAPCGLTPVGLCCSGARIDSSL